MRNLLRISNYYNRIEAEKDWQKISAQYPDLAPLFAPKEGASWRTIDKAIAKLRAAAQRSSMSLDVYLTRVQPTCVYDANITHNLGKMADEAGIYKHLWRPDEIGITKAEQLIEPLRAGLELLKSDPERFKKFNPKNGWGTYEGLVSFVQKYLASCEEYPDAEVSVSQ